MHSRPCEPHQGHTTEPAAEAPAKDPVCGMSVDPATARHRREHGGKTYWFCSGRCAERFESAPEAYLGGGPPAAERAVPKDALYTCPMHPEIEQVGPGDCPICGMALEPKTVTLDAGPSAELVDMTRRLWLGGALALPLLVWVMGDHLLGLGIGEMLPGRLGPWLQLVLATPGRAVGGGAVLPALLGVAPQPQPQHVDADRARRRRRLCSTAWWRRSCPAFSRRRSAGTTGRSRSISRRRR